MYITSDHFIYVPRKNIEWRALLFIQDDRFLLMYDMVVLNCVEVDSDDSTCSFRFTCTVDKYDCFLINITVFHSGDCKSNFHYSIPTKPSGWSWLLPRK